MIYLLWQLPGIWERVSVPAIGWPCPILLRHTNQEVDFFSFPLPSHIATQTLGWSIPIFEQPLPRDSKSHGLEAPSSALNIRVCLFLQAITEYSVQETWFPIRDLSRCYAVLIIIVVYRGCQFSTLPIDTYQAYRSNTRPRERSIELSRHSCLWTQGQSNYVPAFPCLFLFLFYIIL